MSLLFTYVSCNVYTSDTASLRPGTWFTDGIIHFYLDYLSFDFPLSSSTRSLCRFISPQTTFFLLHEDDEKEIAEALESSDLATARFFFFPLNNNSNLTGTGGSHWSMLVADTKLNTEQTADETKSIRFLHFDPIRGTNRHVAKQFADKLTPAILASKGLTPSGAVNFTEYNAPQQGNSTDCGPFTCYFAQEIVSNIDREGDGFDWDKLTWPSDSTSPRISVGDKMRKEIQEKAKEIQRNKTKNCTK